MKIKPTKAVRVVYRNYLFFLLGWLLPKRMILRIRVRGVMRIVSVPIGREFNVTYCKEMYPVRWRDVFFFKVVRYRTRKKGE